MSAGSGHAAPGPEACRLPGGVATPFPDFLVEVATPLPGFFLESGMTKAHPPAVEMWDFASVTTCALNAGPHKIPAASWDAEALREQRVLPRVPLTPGPTKHLQLVEVVEF